MQERGQDGEVANASSALTLKGVDSCEHYRTFLAGPSVTAFTTPAEIAMACRKGENSQENGRGFRFVTRSAIVDL